jgi:hypothetical protein
MFPSSSSVRMARVKAERLARAPHVRTRMFWFRVTPTLATQIEYERALYAVRPSKAETVIQLVEEGLTFRRMNRPKRTKRQGLPPAPPKRPKRVKRVPFVGLD